MALDLTPAPGAAPATARWWAQSRLEWRQLMTNGEQLLLTLIIPIAVLIGVTRLGLAEIDEATPGVMALAILSTAFTATAISTGFERRSGVLKFLGATPLARSGLLVGKTTATFAVIVVQLVLISAVALALGWSPEVGQPVLLVATVVLGTVALGSWGFALAGLLRAEATLAVANGIFLLLLFAGGTVLPSHRLPGPLGGVVQLLPSAALGDALRTLLGAPTQRLRPPSGAPAGARTVGCRRDPPVHPDVPLGVGLVNPSPQPGAAPRTGCARDRPLPRRCPPARELRLDPCSPPTAPVRTSSAPAPSPVTSGVRGIFMANLVAQIGIVLTGGLVRVTKSGLGCPTWPECVDGSIVPVQGQAEAFHKYIEFGNRLLTFVLVFLAIAAIVGALRMRSHWRAEGSVPRRPILLLATIPLLGTLAQAVLGGVTVLTGLHPLMVGAHLLLSIAIIAGCVVLVHRAARAR